jgi:hypothetical protein
VLHSQIAQKQSQGFVSGVATCHQHHYYLLACLIHLWTYPALMAAKRGGGSEGAARQSSEKEHNELEAPGSKQLIPHQFKTFGQHFIVTTWSNFWWWCTVLLSVPFSAYAMVSSM